MSYKIFYFLIAVVSSIFLNLIPLYYVNNGFSEEQIGYLAALFSFAVITQPIIGMIAESKYGIKRTLRLLLFIISIILFLLFFAHSFIVVFIMIFIYATSIAPSSGFTDNIIAEHTLETKKNYGNYKIFCTLGWGIGVFFAIPIINLFSFNAFLIFISILTIVMILMLSRIKVTEHKQQEISFKENIILLFANKNFIILMIFSAIFMGSYNIRGYYQSILMISVTEQGYYIALMTLAMMIPELLVLPHYQKIQSRFSFKSRMVFCIIISSIMMLLFFISSSPIMVLFSSSIHGIIAAIYLPSILFEVISITNKKVVFTAVLLSGTFCNLVTSFLVLTIITPLFTTYGINFIFAGIGILILLSFIPLHFYRTRSKINE